MREDTIGGGNVRVWGIGVERDEEDILVGEGDDELRDPSL